MYCDELGTLLKQHPKLENELRAVDEFFANGVAHSDMNVTVSYVATAIDISIAEAAFVLEKFVENACLVKRLATFCLRENAGIQYYESREQIPESEECDLCSEIHDDDEFSIVVVYVAKRLSGNVPFAGAGGSGGRSPSAANCSFDESADSPEANEKLISSIATDPKFQIGG